MKHKFLIGICLLLCSVVKAEEPLFKPVEWKIIRIESQRIPNINQNVKVFYQNAFLPYNQVRGKVGISEGQLSEFIVNINDAIKENFTHHPIKGTIWVNVDLHNDRKPTFQVGQQGNIDNSLIQQLYIKLKELDTRATSESVSLQIKFALN